MGRRRTLLVGCLVAASVVLVAASAGSSVARATGLVVRTNGDLAFAYGPSLLTVNPKSSAVRPITSCPEGSCEIDEPVWSPKGGRLAFVRGSFGGPNEPSHMSVYVLGANGERPKWLASCGSCGQMEAGRLAWSPNGRWIAFSRHTFGSGYASLWIVSAAGGMPRRLTSCTLCTDTDPTWSPDGRRLLFARLTSNSSSLYTVRPNSSHLTKITDGADPQWSPDGRRIAFDPDPDSIGVADANGSHVHVLLAGAPGNGPGDPSWSPNGKKLVFFWTPGTPSHFTAEVWTMNPDGTHQKRLYHSGCCVGSWGAPIWSPDGKMIAFSADSAGGTFVINADGSGLLGLSSDSPAALSWQTR